MIKIFKQIKFKRVSKTDHDFLYLLLEHRDPKENISHKQMPTFKQHEKFIDSKPYKKWFIIKLDKISIGSIYLSYQNEIGFFLKNEYNIKSIGGYILNKFINENPQKNFFVNINPRNKKSIFLFQKNGFKLIQNTYKL